MADRILRGWKEIATSLETSERSAMRWAKEMGLPVQHLGDSSRAPVFAYEQELQAWMVGSSRQRSSGNSDTAGSAGETPDRREGGIPQPADGRATARPTRKTLWLTGLLALFLPLAAWVIASEVATLRDTAPGPRRATLQKSVTIRLRAPGAADATLVAPDGGSTTVTLPGRPPFRLKSAVSGGRLRLEITQTGTEAWRVAPLVVEIDPSATVRLKRPYPVELTWVAPAGPKVR
jgi:hypothetical protein